MSWKDRTSEFSQIVGKKLKKPLEAPFPSPKTQFTQIASNLGFQIHETAKKLANLTKSASLPSPLPSLHMLTFSIGCAQWSKIQLSLMTKQP